MRYVYPMPIPGRNIRQGFLTDRTPSFSDAVRYVEREFPEAMTYPIIVMGIEHDASCDLPLPRKRTNTSRRSQATIKLSANVWEEERDGDVASTVDAASRRVSDLAGLRTA